MNDRPNHEILNTLLESRGPCVSLYMPTHKAGRETAQDPIRFKNLLRSAEVQAGQRGFSARTTEAVLESPRQLLNDPEFWRHLDVGLAVFAGPEDLHVFRVPAMLPELAVCSPRYYLKPLIAHLSSDSHVYVLTLNKEQARLLEADAAGVRDIDCPGLPASLAAVVPAEDGEPSLQHHTSRRAGAAAVFHGNADEGSDEPLLQYLRACDAAVAKRLRGDSAPLLLAAPERYASLYRQINSHPHLAATTIAGNPEAFDREKIEERVRPEIERLRLEREQSAAGRYREGLSSGLASRQLSQVLQAATEGRVAAVFIPQDTQLLGRWLPETGEADVNPAAEDASDLLDLVATETFLKGGDVLAVPADHMPDQGMVAGVFRY